MSINTNIKLKLFRAMYEGLDPSLMSIVNYEIYGSKDKTIEVKSINSIDEIPSGAKYYGNISSMVAVFENETINQVEIYIL